MTSPEAELLKSTAVICRLHSLFSFHFALEVYIPVTLNATNKTAFANLPSWLEQGKGLDLTSCFEKELSLRSQVELEAELSAAVAKARHNMKKERALHWRVHLVVANVVTEPHDTSEHGQPIEILNSDDVDAALQALQAAPHSLGQLVQVIPGGSDKWQLCGDKIVPHFVASRMSMQSARQLDHAVRILTSLGAVQAKYRALADQRANSIKTNGASNFIKTHGADKPAETTEPSEETTASPTTLEHLEVRVRLLEKLVLGERRATDCKATKATAEVSRGTVDEAMSASLAFVPLPKCLESDLA